ncbi:DCP2-domain-containing protein [Stipitochalara longipes BDJ]|nr:DCP2-domain-containing protein [Stipitochalara longipes BDJ]
MTERKMQLEDWLDDLSTRFIENLPVDDLREVERICFHLEEAQWFYEDFIRPLDPALPSMNLRRFCERMFAHCPTLSKYTPEQHMAAFEYFIQYKSRIPVRGAIMLNDTMDSAVLVKGWKKGANWSFPRGKINLDEDDLTCAMREVYEETGYNLETSGLVPEDRNVKYIEITMREQQIRLYVFRNVPMDTHFEPRTRKEISKIEWWPLSELPAFRKKGRAEQQENVTRDNKFYNVAPFLVQLRKWIIEQRKHDAKRNSRHQHLSATISYDELQTEEEEQGTETNGAAAGLYTTSPLPASDLEVDERSLRLQQQIIQMQQPKEPAGRADQLLALLKNRPTTSDQQTPLQHFPPHTPLEHTLDQAPMPRTPYHQHPRPVQFSSMPPPPTYPIHPQNETFSYQLPDFQTTRQPTYSEHAYKQSQQVQRSHENPHSNQSQHLVHPQPLPPHVQRAVFTGGPVHSPMMPPPIQQQLPQQLTSTVSVTVNNPQFPGLHAPMVPQIQRQSPPKLTEHHLSLLNAFKSKKDDASSALSTQNDLPLRRYVQEPMDAQHPPQELPGDASRIPLKVNVSSVEVQYTSNANSGLIPSMITPRQAPSEEQKSALLSMFKSPATIATVPANPVGSTALPISATPSAVELSAVEPLSQNAASTLALLNDKRTPGHAANNGSIPELNPEASLPFRALSILPRPSELSDNEAPLRNGSGHKVHAKTNGGGHSRNTTGQASTAKPPDKPFQPQILKRPQAGPSKAVEPSPVPQSAFPAFSPPLPDARPAQTADHKQTLLSLFGKASAQANPLPRIPTSDPTQQLPMAPATAVSSRSRVGSLASGEGPSRRGSQVPISPADKNFLLNYLGAVTK